MTAVGAHYKTATHKFGTKVAYLFNFFFIKFISAQRAFDLFQFGFFVYSNHLNPLRELDLSQQTRVFFYDY